MSKICTMIMPHLQRRSMSVVAKSLRYTEYGEPKDVIKCVEEKLDAPADTEVLVKMLAAPINPADINTIQGFSPNCRLLSINDHMLNVFSYLCF